MNQNELSQIYHRGVCRKRDQLFVPSISSQTSVIKHTNDFKQPAVGCKSKHERLDSGIDSWDDEEERQNLANVFSDSSTDSKESDTLTKRCKLSTPLSLEKLVDVDVEKLHSAVSPVSFPMFDLEFKESSLFKFDTHTRKTYNNDTWSRNQNKEIGSTDLDTANVDLSYLFHLYEQAEPGHLKNTILKLIRNVSNEQCKKLSEVHETLKEQKRTLSFGIDNIMVDEAQDTNNKYKLDLVLPPLVPARAERRSFSQSSNEDAQSLPSPIIYPSPTESIYSDSRAFGSQADNLDFFFGKKFTEKPSAEKSFHCEYCHKCFNHKNALQRHLLTHKGKRTHKCTQCSRSFYEQTAYLRHLQSHNGEKAHKCEQCSMAFSKRSALEVHIRTHTGERPFKCKFCGKGFSISGNLHRHILIHTGHRPYKCGKCPRAFNNPSHLARHISSFHT